MNTDHLSDREIAAGIRALGIGITTLSTVRMSQFAGSDDHAQAHADIADEEEAASAVMGTLLMLRTERTRAREAPAASELPDGPL